MAEYLAKLQEKTWLSRELTLSFSGVVDEKTAFFSGNFAKYSVLAI